MLIGPKTWQSALNSLDELLFERKLDRTLIVCGGTALLVLDVIDRETRDIDVVSPEIDGDLKRATIEVAKILSLPVDWVNDGPKGLAADLMEGWRMRVVPLYKGKALSLLVLGRIDLLATKVYAFCDREDDYQDVIKLKPKGHELDQIYAWVLERDGSQLWPERVESCFERLRRAING